jgi:phage gpG-like protein
MTPQEAIAAIKKREADLARFYREDYPRILGDEAVKHFNQSFVNEGFTDKSLKKWDEVERRKPDSPWYGFEKDATSPRPGDKKRKKAEPIKKTNFSPNATERSILKGKGMAALKDATDYIIKPDRVTVRNDRPYAKVHNYGETAKIFGKKSFSMPKRQFIGHSAVLNKAITDQVAREMKRQGLIK